LAGLRTLREAMRTMAKQTVGQIRNNFWTQGINPLGEAWHGQRSWTTAQGWFEENRRREAGESRGWYSTGEGAKSFRWEVNGDLDCGDVPPRNLSFDFFFAEHLLYAEAGVGKMGDRIVTKDMVKRDSPADYRHKYNEWRPWEGRTQRPSIRMEFRHLSGRLQLYLAARYNLYFRTYVLMGMEGVTGTRNMGAMGGKMEWYVKSDTLPNLPYGPK